MRANVTSIEFHTDGIVPNVAITSFDVTHSTSNGEVTLYIVDDGLGNNMYKAIIVGDDVIYAPENCIGLFYNMSNLTSFNSKNFRVDNVTSMSSMFSGCTNLIDISSLLTWNTSKVIDMGAMFAGCTNLIDVNGVQAWNVSNVTDMQVMFSGCNNLVDINSLLNWDVSNVSNMSGLFRQCSSLDNINAIENWNVEKVENMAGMFQSCVNIEEIDLSEWKTSSLTNMQSMFGMWNNNGTLRIDSKLKRIVLSNQFNTSNVTNMSELFANNTNIEDYSFLQYVDTSNLEGSLRTMFQCNYGLQNEDLEYVKNWNIENVTNFEWMFSNCINLTDASAINNWNINKDANYTSMFKNTPVHPEFTQVAGTWDSQGTFTPTV